MMKTTIVEQMYKYVARKEIEGTDHWLPSSMRSSPPLLLTMQFLDETPPLFPIFNFSLFLLLLHTQAHTYTHAHPHTHFHSY